MFFLVRNAILVISSLSALSLPRLPRNALHFQPLEKCWYRWESRITFIGYTLGMALILILRDYDALPGSICFNTVTSKGLDDESFFFILVGSLFLAGLTSIIVLECYLKWGSHLLCEHRRYEHKAYQEE